VLEFDKRGGMFGGGHDTYGRYTVAHEDADRVGYDEGHGHHRGGGMGGMVPGAALGAAGGFVGGMVAGEIVEEVFEGEDEE
jgi:sporulation-control protein